MNLRCLFFIVIMLSVVVLGLTGAPVPKTNKTQEVTVPVPISVTLYGDVQRQLHMICIPGDTGLLYDQTQTITPLDTPSEFINPGTFYDRGKFYATIDTEGKKAIEIGQTITHEIDGFILRFFRRNGPGEKSVGCDFDGKIWAVPDNGTPEKIAERQYHMVTTPQGEKRNALMHRITKPQEGKWIGDLGNELFEEQEDGKLVQIGWIEWRVITLPGEKKVTIIMTKALNNGKWTGRYDGVLYQDK